MKTKAYICEVFDSIQGEGIYLGLRQLFIRFSGCNLRCLHCDTLYALEKSKICTIFNNKKIVNPISAHELECAIEEKRDSCHSISLTGGEPLTQSEFIKIFLSKKRSSNKVYLETNGILYKELKRVIDGIDIISMDIKLPSFSGQEMPKEEHREFLKVAKNKDLFVKIVVTENTSLNEVKEAAILIESVDQNIPLVLQSLPSLMKKKSFLHKLFIFQEELTKRLIKVRIIPQIHKLLKIK